MNSRLVNQIIIYVFRWLPEDLKRTLTISAWKTGKMHLKISDRAQRVSLSRKLCCAVYYFLLKNPKNFNEIHWSSVAHLKIPWIFREFSNPNRTKFWDITGVRQYSLVGISKEIIIQESRTYLGKIFGEISIKNEKKNMSRGQQKFWKEIPTKISE